MSFEDPLEIIDKGNDFDGRCSLLTSNRMAKEDREKFINDITTDRTMYSMHWANQILNTSHIALTDEQRNKLEQFVKQEEA